MVEKITHHYIYTFFMTFQTDETTPKTIGGHLRDDANIVALYGGDVSG